MKRWIAGLAVVLSAATLTAFVATTDCISTAQAAAAEEPSKMLAHNVYFSLKDNSPANVQSMVDDCQKYLADHPGVVFFACGTVCEDLDRPINDRDFDVALHVVFDSREAHDKYQTAPDHITFIEKNRDGWKQVRVFDSDVVGAK